MKEFFNHTITLNVLLCISYFVLAQLGFEWGALTANATLLWPPSGLAVFSFIVFGHRVLPGLLLGAILSSQMISLSNPIGNNFFSLLLACVNGGASILQALLIAQLSRTYYQHDFRVSTTASAIFTLIVLASCTLSATIGNITLWQAGIINFSTALENWSVWWIGDVIGVLLVAPLLLWVYRKQTLYESSQANAFLIFCAGVGLMLLTVAAVGHNERETYRKNLIHETENLQASMQANIDLATRDLSTLQEYFLNNTPNQDQFRKLTEPLLKRNLWLDSFSLTPSTDRYQQTPKANFEIDYSAGLTLVHTSETNFLWREPNSKTFPALFLNSISTRLAPTHSDIFLQNNTNTNTNTNTNMGGDKKMLPNPSMNIAAPIYYCKYSPKTNCKIFHLVSSELNLNALMRAAVARNEFKNIDIRLAIHNRTGELTYWQWDNNYWHPAPRQGESIINAPTKLNGKTPSIKIMDSEWQLLVRPKNVTIWFLPNLQQCIIFIIGLAMVILLSAYLQALYRQDQLIIENQARLEDEINTQTQALRVANDWLLKEIEAKRTTQEQLKDSEAHMRTLLDNIPDPIWFKTVEGQYLNFNKAVETIFQHTSTELEGNTVSNYATKELEDAIQHFDEQALNSYKAESRQLWMYIPSRKEKRLMDTIKVAVRDDAQQPIGILSIARDITEQHQLINELEKFKRFAEYASEGFSIMTLTAETLYMNRSMQKMLLSNQELKHNDFLNYFPQDLHSQWRESILPHVLLNSYWQGELSALRTDGSRFPTKETFFIIRDDKGQPIYLGEVMIDISEQKQVEASLQLAKEAAEEATRAKSRFLANMSHEIRTPLNAVLGYSQLLMTDTHLSAQQHERMHAILNAGQRLLHLINDILDLSKIEAGALHFRHDYFDLHQELNDMIALMRTKATAKGLALNYDIQLPTPTIVKSDRQKIGQIILNLLGNAIKFTHSGDVSLHVQFDSQGILFNIIDTGPGISAQELQLLFAAFKQGKSGEESGGTGLGLVISKHIAESLGGELTLDSEPGKGTRAHLRLPIEIEYNPQLDNAPQAVQAKLAENSHCKVLVVEDDDASRDVLVHLLQDMGCEVIEAVNGAEGLAQAFNQKPDIVFTDIRMPTLTGSEMLHELRKVITKDALPVIAVSASSLEHERTFYLAEGFHEFIGKPYQFRDIYSALQKFTTVQFALAKNNIIEENSANAEKLCWNNSSELSALQKQLETLKSALNTGDMNNSKKLFLLQSVQTLGKNAYQKIQNTIRQYDLVSAEKMLDELLAEITERLSEHTDETSG